MGKSTATCSSCGTEVAKRGRVVAPHFKPGSRCQDCPGSNGPPLAKGGTSSAAVREALLDSISSGLRVLGTCERTSKVELWRVEVALFDEDGQVLAVGSLPLSLSWIMNGIHQTEDAIDISNAVAAHVQVFEGSCVEGRCEGKSHRAPGEER